MGQEVPVIYRGEGKVEGLQSFDEIYQKIVPIPKGAETIAARAKKTFGITSKPENSLYITVDGELLGNRGLAGGAEHQTFTDKLLGVGKPSTELAEQSGMLEIVYSPDAELNVRFFAKPTSSQVEKVLELSKTVPKTFIDDMTSGKAVSVPLNEFSVQVTGKPTAIPAELEPLAQEARKYKSAKEFVKVQMRDDFQKRTIAAQEMVDEIKAAGLKKSVNPSGTITIYHGTSNENAEIILKSGKLNEESFFSPLKSKSAFGSEGAADYVKNKFGNKGQVLEIKVDARDINFNGGTGEIEAPKGLVRGEDGIWKAPERNVKLVDLYNQATKGVGAKPTEVKKPENIQTKREEIATETIEKLKANNLEDLINDDGSITLFHKTTALVASNIERTGFSAESFFVSSEEAADQLASIKKGTPKIMQVKVAADSIFFNEGTGEFEASGKLTIGRDGIYRVSDDFIKKEYEIEEKPLPPAKPAKPTTKEAISKKAKVPTIRKISSIWRAASGAGRGALPILDYVSVKDGLMRMTNLDMFLSINTKQKDGVYQLIGEDLVALDPKLEEEFPNFPVPKESIARVLLDTLRTALKQALPSTPTDNLRPVLKSVHLDFKSSGIEITTTDGFRLFHKRIGAKNIGKGSYNISPGKILTVLDLLEGEPLDLSVDKKNERFVLSNSAGMIGLRIVEGDFPLARIKSIYPKIDRVYKVGKKELLQAMKDIAPYAKGSGNGSIFSLETNQLVITAKREGAEKKVTLNAKITEVKIPEGSVINGSLIMPIELKVVARNTVGLNYRFVQDAAKASETNDVFIGYSTTEKGDQKLSPIYFGGVMPRVTQKVSVKAPSQPTGNASIDRFSDLKNVAKSMSYYKAVEFPEVLRMVKELTGKVPSVKYPRVRKTLGGRPLGIFTADKEGEITLNPDLFENPEKAVKTLAHEVGHLADYLPERTLKRGNLVARIASLNLSMKHKFGELNDPDIRGELRKLTQLWKPFDEETSPEGFIKYRYSAKELYADAISVLFNDPQLLKENAPNFWQGWFDYIDKKPEVKQQYFDTMDLLNKGDEAVLSEREKDIRAMFQKGEDLYRVKIEEKKLRDNNFFFLLKY